MLSTSSPPQRLLTTSAPPRHLSTSGDGKTWCGRRGRRRNVACGRGGTLYVAWNFCTWRLPDLYVAWIFLYVASRKTSHRIVLTTCMQRLYCFGTWPGVFCTWRRPDLYVAWKILYVAWILLSTTRHVPTPSTPSTPRFRIPCSTC